MKSSYLVALLSVPLSSVLAGCCNHAHHDDPSGTEVIQPAENAPSGPLPACTGQPAAGISGPQTKVTPGRYCVCNVATHEVHENYQAAHFAEKQVVTIDPLDFVTPVQLGVSRVQMARFGSDEELSALLRYQHKNNDTGRTESVVHLVRITPANPQLPVGSCQVGTMNVLKISFCFPKKAGGWACDAVSGGHLGDTHVQN